jgi:hypothetical protein
VKIVGSPLFINNSKIKVGIFCQSIFLPYKISITYMRFYSAAAAILVKPSGRKCQSKIYDQSPSRVCMKNLCMSCSLWIHHCTTAIRTLHPSLCNVLHKRQDIVCEHSSVSTVCFHNWACNQRGEVLDAIASVHS